MSIPALQPRRGGAGRVPPGGALAGRAALLRPARFPRPWQNGLAVLQLPEQ